MKDWTEFGPLCKAITPSLTKGCCDSRQFGNLQIRRVRPLGSRRSLPDLDVSAIEGTSVEHNQIIRGHGDEAIMKSIHLGHSDFVHTRTMWAAQERSLTLGLTSKSADVNNRSWLHGPEWWIKENERKKKGKEKKKKKRKGAQMGSSGSARIRPA